LNARIARVPGFFVVVTRPQMLLFMVLPLNEQASLFAICPTAVRQHEHRKVDMLQNRLDFGGACDPSAK
jgi:hypothetical protein